MNLLDHINATLKPFLTGAGKLWHNDVEPFLSNLLTSVSHAELKLVTDTAAAYVEQALPALTKAAATGDWETFTDTQGSVIASTASELEKQSQVVAVTALTTGVNALISGHPAVVAATTAPQPSPEPAAAPATAA